MDSATAYSSDIYVNTILKYTYVKPWPSIRALIVNHVFENN